MFWSLVPSITLDTLRDPTLKQYTMSPPKKPTEPTEALRRQAPKSSGNTKDPESTSQIQRTPETWSLNTNVGTTMGY